MVARVNFNPETFGKEFRTVSKSSFKHVRRNKGPIPMNKKSENKHGGLYLCKNGQDYFASPKFLKQMKRFFENEEMRKKRKQRRNVVTKRSKRNGSRKGPEMKVSSERLNQIKKNLKKNKRIAKPKTVKGKKSSKNFAQKKVHCKKLNEVKKETKVEDISVQLFDEIVKKTLKDALYPIVKKTYNCDIQLKKIEMLNEMMNSVEKANQKIKRLKAQLIVDLVDLEKERIRFKENHKEMYGDEAFTFSQDEFNWKYSMNNSRFHKKNMNKMHGNKIEYAFMTIEGDENLNEDEN